MSINNRDNNNEGNYSKRLCTQEGSYFPQGSPNVITHTNIQSSRELNGDVHVFGTLSNFGETLTEKLRLEQLQKKERMRKRIGYISAKKLENLEIDALFERLMIGNLSKEVAVNNDLSGEVIKKL